jgi:hypothetical protein
VSTKVHRCPVRDQIREKNLADQVRQYVESHRDDPKLNDWINDRDQCDQQAEFVRFIAEETIVPRGTKLTDMPRSRKGHIVPLGLMRNILVRCPIHGEQELQEVGHHVSVKIPETTP